MRHRKAGRKFGRTPAHRKALFRNMARSLVTYERIRTTEHKAKELSKVADNLVSMALKNDLPARRQAYRILENHQLVKKLFDEIGPRFVGVPGGFTRVVKLGAPRKGDNAALAVIEFTRLAGEAAPEPKAKKQAPKAEAKPKAEPKAPEKEEAAAPAAEAAPEAPVEEAPAEAPAEETVETEASAEAEEGAEAEVAESAEAEAAPEAVETEEPPKASEEAPAEETEESDKADK